MPEVAAGGWVLRAQVPEGIFTLGVEADERTAAAEHAAFADRCRPLLLRAVGGDATEVGWLRDDPSASLVQCARRSKRTGSATSGRLPASAMGGPRSSCSGSRRRRWGIPSASDADFSRSGMPRHCSRPSRRHANQRRREGSADGSTRSAQRER